jgi:hypothetical protein
MSLRSYVPQFVTICRKLALYILKHQHKMFPAIDRTDFLSDEEKQQLKALCQQIVALSGTFDKMNNRF